MYNLQRVFNVKFELKIEILVNTVTNDIFLFSPFH